MDFSQESLSLYFGLQDGRKADLKIVSLAAIEWTHAVQLAATMLDPELKVRIELINAHEGSLSLNTVFDWAEEALQKMDPSKSAHPRLLALAIGLAVFLIFDAGPALDYWLGDADTLELTESDRKRLDQLLEEISKSKELKPTNQKFFRILSHDPGISSVGITERPGKNPAIIVPSEQFPERGGLWDTIEESLERTSERQSKVILESPDLSEANRVWRFQDVATGTSFTAKMRDEKFLQYLREGSITENLRTGIEMQIQIRFKEQSINGDWQPVPSTIEVIHVTFD